jgi:hypothetical protein
MSVGAHTFPLIPLPLSFFPIPFFLVSSTLHPPFLASTSSTLSTLSRPLFHHPRRFLQYVPPFFRIFTHSSPFLLLLPPFPPPFLTLFQSPASHLLYRHHLLMYLSPLPLPPSPLPPTLPPPRLGLGITPLSPYRVPAGQLLSAGRSASGFNLRQFCTGLPLQIFIIKP